MIGEQTHQYSRSLQSHRFLGHTGRSDDQSRWVYTDTDLPPYNTRHWGSPEGRTDRLDTDSRQQRKCQSVITVLTVQTLWSHILWICSPLTQSTIMNDGGNTADEFGAHLSQGGHRRHHEGIHTHVANHLLPPLLCLRLVALETRKLSVFGNQNQLLGERNKVVYRGASVTFYQLYRRAKTKQIAIHNTKLN